MGRHTKADQSFTTFFYAPNFTGYMKVVERIVRQTQREHLKILDIPAGNGMLAQKLRSLGHNVTCADLNTERKEYDFVNMEKTFPYPDGAFDTVICLEGMEHVIDAFYLVREICRVLAPGGFAVISLPNVQSFYSRLKFLFTGTFYQFEPEHNRHPRGTLMDRGHPSPVTLVQMAYLFGEFDFRPKLVTGDKIKKKILFPLYIILWAVNLLCARFRSRKIDDPEIKILYRFLTSSRCLMSRSMVSVWSKDANHP
jgi:SAM-dependent methyltransferase